MRPNDILDGWSVPELIVAYGQYVNEDAREANESWQCQYGAKSKIKRPEEPPIYRVNFIMRGGDDG